MTDPTTKYFPFLLLGVMFILVPLAYYEADKNMYLRRDNAELESIIKGLELQLQQREGRCPGHDTMFHAGEGMRYLFNRERGA